METETSHVASGSGALSISLHPLVLVNISDHFTRVKVQSEYTSTPRVIGAILGSQSGRTIEIFNSFELVYIEVEGQVVIDTDYLRNKLEQFQKVFKNYDVLGWYSTGRGVLNGDLTIQKSLVGFNESPLYLIVDPVSLPQANDIPVSLYESELRILDGVATEVFVQVTFKVETMEAERIAVDHVARVAPDNVSSEIVAHLDGMNQAIHMLYDRIAVIEKFLEASKKGEVPHDQGLLRQIASLCNRLPALEGDAFSGEFLKEYSDGMLFAYLGVLTKGINTANDLVDKYMVVQSASRGSAREKARLPYY